MEDFRDEIERDEDELEELEGETREDFWELLKNADLEDLHALFRYRVLQEVSLDRIFFNKLNFAAILKPSLKLRSLKANLRICGDYNNAPLIANHPEHPDRFLCVAGEARILAALEEGRKTLPCVVLGGLSEEEAMLILANDNLDHKLECIPARVNEAYWAFRNLAPRVKDVQATLRVVAWGLLLETRSAARDRYIYPGWYFGHSKFMAELVELAGPRRENLELIAFEREQLMKMKLYVPSTFLKILAPPDLAACLHPPHEDDIEIFDQLLSNFIYRELGDATEPEFLERMRAELRKATLNRAESLVKRDEDGVVSRIRRMRKLPWLTPADKDALLDLMTAAMAA